MVDHSDPFRRAYPSRGRPLDQEDGAGCGKTLGGMTGCDASPAFGVPLDTMPLAAQVRQDVVMAMIGVSRHPIDVDNAIRNAGPLTDFILGQPNDATKAALAAAGDLADLVEKSLAMSERVGILAARPFYDRIRNFRAARAKVPS